MTPGEGEVYQLELDWPEYYNHNDTADAPDWQFPVVFLVQVRLFRDLGGSIFSDQEAFGDELFQDELFSPWRSLVWVS